MGNSNKPARVEEPNVVYLFQFSRWAFGPCQSMPCVRVEAFLRFHKIPHVVVTSGKFGPYGRCPWIRLNGKSVSDSQLIIEYLTKELKLKTATITEEQKGIAMAVERMLDFHVYAFTVRWNWVDTFDIIKRYTIIKIGPSFVSLWIKKFLRGRVIKYLNTGGWGDYSIEEYRLQWVQDVKAIEQILGSNTYLFGNSVTQTDLSAYAYLHCHTKMPDHCVHDALRELLKEGTPLNKYLGRIEQLIYPDMEEIISRAGSKKSERFPKSIGDQ